MVCEGACFHSLSHTKHPVWLSFSSSHLGLRNFPCHFLPRILSRSWSSTAVFSCFLTFCPNTSSAMLLLDVGCGWLMCTLIPTSLAYFVASFTSDWWPWSTARSSKSRTNCIVGFVFLYNLITALILVNLYSFSTEQISSILLFLSRDTQGPLIPADVFHHSPQ